MRQNSKAIPARLQNTTPTNEAKKFYFLAAGTVFFFPVGKPEEVGSLQLNGVFANSSGQIPVSGIADAQRVLQQQAADRMHKSGLTIEIVDVQLTSITKLGHMTPSEFHDLDAPKAPADVAPAKVN